MAGRGRRTRALVDESLDGPGNAHLLQARLDLKKETFVLDINDACTGFVRALAVVDAIIAAGLARTVLLLAADTYTKLYDPSELKVSPLFSDGASVLIVSGAPRPTLRTVSSHTSGRSSLRPSDPREATQRTSASHLMRSRESGHLTMNGGAVYTFVLRNIAEVVQDLTDQAGSLDDVSWYVRADRIAGGHRRREGPERRARQSLPLRRLRQRGSELHPVPACGRFG